MSEFKFSVGPWNVHAGADSYGPATRKEIPLEEKFKRFKEIGFDAVQFHDDDAVPNLNELTEEEIKEEARKLKKLLDKYGLKAEFVAPRLWMDPHTIDGGFMSTRKEDREFAMWRAKRSIDIAKELGTDLLVLWLAREGTLCAESKSPVWATKQLVSAINEIKENVDVYITGSNSWLLSGELATLLSGRYVEINMLPFSFSEFYESRGGGDEDRLFAEYLSDGAFPYIATMDRTKEKVDMYLEGTYNTVIVKDVEERLSRKEDPNRRKVTDIALLKNISKFLANCVGSPISVKKIADYITSSGRKVSPNTVDDYIEALTEAYIFYRAERYDVEGKQLLKQNGKLYIVDLGLRRYLLPKRNYDLGYSLENIVFLELVRRGYRVNVGKAGNAEIDFAAGKDDILEYYQVSASLIEQTTFEREIAPLRKIGDNYPKKILTLDRFTPGNYEGIEVINAIDWLLGRI